MPFTPQFTEVLPVPVTAPVTCKVFPSKTFALGGVTDTVTAGGGGGDEPELAPPPQPGKIAKAASNPNSRA